MNAPTYSISDLALSVLSHDRLSVPMTQESLCHVLEIGLKAIAISALGRPHASIDLENGFSLVCGVQEHGDAVRFTRHSVFDLIAHLYRQREFSNRTFGPGARTTAVVAHIRKELIEVEEDPADIYEWVDLVLPALDGAWRAGHAPEDIAQAIHNKQGINEGRDWPDWRNADPAKPIEHVREVGQ